MAGLAFIGWAIHNAGVKEIWSTLKRLGWAAPFLLLPYLFVYLIDTHAWRLCFKKEERSRVSYLQMFRIRWAGEAVNNSIPTGYIGGEAVKVYLLHKRGILPSRGTTTAIVSKSCQILSLAVFIALGVFCATFYLPEAPEIRRGMILITCIVILAVFVLFWFQLHGSFTCLFKLLHLFHIHIRPLENRREHLVNLDRQVLDFYQSHHNRFFAVTAIYLLGWLADTVEIFIVMYLLQHPLAPLQALSIESMVSIVKALGLFVPGAVGVQEGGILTLFKLFALSANAAITYAIIRRARELAFALLGWLLLYHEEGTLHGLQHKVKDAET